MSVASSGRRSLARGALAAALLAAALAACSTGSPARTPTPAASSTAAATTTATAERSPSPTSTSTPGATVTPAARLEPIGFPLDPLLHADRVVGKVGARRIEAGAGPTLFDYSSRQQAAADPGQANESGWDCRVHLEYENAPAVDWYVQPGEPVRSTMDGIATLIINTTVNAFDFYGVSREPYIGNPDRARAPVAPFPGPGGGMGVYVSVANDGFRTDYGHFSLAPAIAGVPDSAFFGGYTRATDYASTFAVPRSAGAGDMIATWPVRRGDVIGFTGDTGYSEAPHVHYAITRLLDGEQLCPTNEPGFDDGGWLLR
jgi:hypothetical protein